MDCESFGMSFPKRMLLHYVTFFAALQALSWPEKYRKRKSELPTCDSQQPERKPEKENAGRKKGKRHWKGKRH